MYIVAGFFGAFLGGILFYAVGVTIVKRFKQKSFSRFKYYALGISFLLALSLHSRAMMFLVGSIAGSIVTSFFHKEPTELSDD